jgi:hypothetical protein
MCSSLGPLVFQKLPHGQNSHCLFLSPCRYVCHQMSSLLNASISEKRNTGAALCGNYSFQESYVQGILFRMCFNLSVRIYKLDNVFLTRKITCMQCYHIIDRRSIYYNKKYIYDRGRNTGPLINDTMWCFPFAVLWIP